MDNTHGFHIEDRILINYDGSESDIVLPAGIVKIGSTAFMGKNVQNVIVPEGVVSIGRAAFANSHLTSISLPNSIKDFGDAVFSYCFNLKKISIPNGVERIESGIFTNSSLECIDLPDSIKWIKYHSFYGTAIQTIHLPSSINVIDEGAFMSCWELTEITLPDNIRALMKDTFKNCWNLQRITLPSQLTKLDLSAFDGCSGLCEFITSSKSIKFVAPDGVLYNRKMTELVKYPAGKKDSRYNVPKSVTKIRKTAFQRAKYLKQLIVPSHLKECVEQIWLPGNEFTVEFVED